MDITNFVESLLFGSGRPLKISEIKTCLENSETYVELSDIKRSLNELEDRYSNSALEISEVASGYRISVKKEFSPILSNFWNDKPQKISKALMETIAIIAYKQPVTRGDIEDIRGVNVSTNSIRSLLEREWIKVSGFKDSPGRPALYKTTAKFLDDHNLKSINSLPRLPEKIQDSIILNSDLLRDAI